MEKVKTIVSIGGKQYTICGVESAEYIHRVALKVNQKLSEIKKGNPALNNIQLAMLTSINIADDYVKLYDENETAKKELALIKKELERRGGHSNVTQMNFNK
ncbi:MAG: cell division protein ZapA [Christensenellaceae bacterium]